MKINSSAFLNGEMIPKKYSCKGENLNPPLEIFDVPKNAESLVFIIEDPDAPSGTFYHWVLFNIPKDLSEFNEGSIPKYAIEGVNSTGKTGYIGPCPPSGFHRYIFKLFAIDKNLPSDKHFSAEEMYTLIKDHIIDGAEILGLFGES